MIIIIYLFLFNFLIEIFPLKSTGSLLLLGTAPFYGYLYLLLYANQKKISLESKKLSKYYLILFFLFFSITLTALFIGFENLDFNEYAWLFTGNDMSAHQIGWYFLKMIFGVFQ